MQNLEANLYQDSLRPVADIILNRELCKVSNVSLSSKHLYTIISISLLQCHCFTPLLKRLLASSD